MAQLLIAAVVSVVLVAVLTTALGWWDGDDAVTATEPSRTNGDEPQASQTPVEGGARSDEPDGMPSPAPSPPPEPTSDTRVAPPTPTPPVGAGPALPPLQIAPIAAGLPPYDRERFEHWIDADGDGCNTRDEVLIEESLDLPQVDPFRCDVVAGRWYDPYVGVETTNPGDLQIDHFVALANAWRSGAWAWDDALRMAFANDLDTPAALNAVTGAANQSKADKGPESWRPPNQEYWCEYALGWAEVKAKWGLTVTPEEWEALQEMALTCPAGP